MKKYAASFLLLIISLSAICQRQVSAGEYGQLEETFNPAALAVMGDWLQKNVTNN